jgi:hypothetical protein
MRHAKVELKLLIAALVLTVLWQSRLASTEGRAFAQDFAQEPTALQTVPSHAETVLAGDAFMPCEIQCLPAPFAVGRPPVGPAWYFQAEGMALKRDASGDQTFQAFVDRVWEEVENPKYDPEADPPDPTEPEWIWQWAGDTVTSVLGTQSLHFGFQGGARTLVGRTLGRCHAMEVSYFAVTDWDEIAAVRDDTEFIEDKDRETGVETTFPASLFSPFSDFGDPAIAGLDYNHLAYISYESSLDNLEWNLRRWILMDPHRLTASVLVGGRYMNINEGFRYHTESAVPDPLGAVNTATTNTKNSLIGAQIGAMFEFHVDPCWWVDCEVKGAVFNNDVRQTTVYAHDGVRAYQGRHVGRCEDDITAWALDLRLNATVLITPRLAVIGGYQALWLDGLALASENMSQNVDVLVSGPATLVEDGKVLYHGPHLGLTWSW